MVGGFNIISTWLQPSDGVRSSLGNHSKRFLGRQRSANETDFIYALHAPALL